MNTLILGADGMIGRKLVARLVSAGRLGDRAIERLTLFDVTMPSAPVDAPFEINGLSGDLALPGQAERLMMNRPDVIFHLAAVVSGEAEADFEKGYRVNLEGTHACSRPSADRVPATSPAWCSRLRLLFLARPFPIPASPTSFT
jgi:nucleoside-diphosphate-sugar epimerase